MPALGTAAVRAFERFMATMHVLRERVEADAPVAQLLDETLQETGYLESLEAERTIEAQGRIENLQELIEVAREYDAGNRREARWPTSCSRSRSSPTPTSCATTRASSRS